MKQINELRNLSEKELNDELLSLRKQQFTLRMKKANDGLEQTHHFAALRKSIAQLKTVMTEKVGKSDDK